MNITIEEKDIEKAKRILSTDDAFSLLWEIDQCCRSIIKYDEKIDRDESLAKIRDMISESNLLDLYQ